MTEQQKDAYLRKLETMTLEYQHAQKKGAFQKPPVCQKQMPKKPRILHAEKGLIGDAHFIHITKHSDIHAGHRAFPHSHDFFEFNFVCRGCCHNNVNGKELLLGTSDLLLMNPHAVHSCWVDDTSSQVVNFLILPEMIESIFVNLMSANDPITQFFLDSLYGQSKMPDYILFRINDTVMDLFWNIIDEFLQHRPLFQQVILSNILWLFAELLRLNPIAQKPVQKESPLLTEILSYIKANYATVSLQKLSETFHYSPVYISRFVKKETGKSFSRVLTEQRLSRACNYLKNSTISAETISELIGYKDVSYFYKIFKQEYHMNPSEYRKQQKIQRPGS